MNNFSKEFCWTIKRFYPLGISLILLGILVKNFKFILPSILENEYFSYIQVAITITIFALSVRHLYKIKAQVKMGLSKHEKISFGILVYLALVAEAGANSLAINIFLINLFGIAYMKEDVIRDQLMFFTDYVWGLLIVPFVGWYIFVMLRKYLTTKLEWDKSNSLVPPVMITVCNRTESAALDTNPG